SAELFIYSCHCAKMSAMENVLSNLTTLPDIEFRSIKRALPIRLLKHFMLMTISYGMVLTLTLPFNLMDGIFNVVVTETFGVIGCIIFASLYIVTMLRWCVVHPIAFRGFYRTLSAPLQRAAVEPFVSVLVPAFNEADTMEAALRSLIALDYPNYEVIVRLEG